MNEYSNYITQFLTHSENKNMMFSDYYEEIQK